MLYAIPTYYTYGNNDFTAYGTVTITINGSSTTSSRDNTTTNYIYGVYVNDVGSPVAGLVYKYGVDISTLNGPLAYTNGYLGRFGIFVSTLTVTYTNQAFSSLSSMTKPTANIIYR